MAPSGPVNTIRCRPPIFRNVVTGSVPVPGSGGASRCGRRGRRRALEGGGASQISPADVDYRLRERSSAPVRFSGLSGDGRSPGRGRTGSGGPHPINSTSIRRRSFMHCAGTMALLTLGLLGCGARRGSGIRCRHEDGWTGGIRRCRYRHGAEDRLRRQIQGRRRGPGLAEGVPPAPRAADGREPGRRRGGLRARGADQLETLDLSRTKVGDAGLAGLEGLDRLRSLDLKGTGVTDAGLAHLSGLPGSRSST